MDKYIEQLIELIRAAYQNRPESEPVKDLEDEFAEIEAYVSGDFEVVVEEGFGIPQAYFPPEDRLSDAQIDLLVPEFEALWNHFRFYLCFPEKINQRWKYILMRKELSERHHMIRTEHGAVNIEFCSYDADDCDLPKEFCCGGYEE